MSHLEAFFYIMIASLISAGATLIIANMFFGVKEDTYQDDDVDVS